MAIARIDEYCDLNLSRFGLTRSSVRIYGIWEKFHRRIVEGKTFCKGSPIDDGDWTCKDLMVSD